MTRVAILGAGPAGQAYAVALSHVGHDVAVWFPGFADTEHQKLAVVANNGIRAVGALEGTARPAVITSNIGEAVCGADLLIFATPGRVHGRLALQVSPYVASRQMVLLSPGRTGGAFEVQATFRSVSDTIPGVAELSSSPFTARLIDRNCVRVAYVKRSIGMSCLRRRDCGELSKIVGSIVIVEPHDNVLRTTFENLGAIYHVIPMLFSAARIENSGLSVYYDEAISPAVARVMEAADDERCDVAEAFGVAVPSALELAKVRYGSTSIDLCHSIFANAVYRTIGGVSDLTHRYLMDDLPTSVAPFVAFGRMAGLSMPVHESALCLGCALYGVDVCGFGRTADVMGLNGMKVEDVYRLGAGEAD